MLFILRTIIIVTPTVQTTWLLQNFVTEPTEIHHSNNNTLKNINCTKPRCIVICDREYGCTNITINGNQSTLFELKCTAKNACNHIHIIAGGQNISNIYCTEDQSCFSSAFDVKNSRISNIKCNGSYSCFGATVNTTYSLNSTVKCHYPSCNGMEIHCPMNGRPCKVSCILGSCYINVYGSNGTEIQLKNDDSGIKYYCGESPANEEWITSFDYANYICLDDEWHFVYVGTMDCKGQEEANCFIDCEARDCRNHFINGSAASDSFTVQCKRGRGSIDRGCSGATISCPVYSSSLCTVDCVDNSACQGISIVANNVYYVNVSCIALSACDYMVLDAANSYSLDLRCDGCSYSTIYCPSDRIDACNIECIGDEFNKWICNLMSIEVDDDYVYDYLSLLVTDSYFIIFECDNKTSTYYKSKYHCTKQSSPYCCPWLGPIECDMNMCSIDCSNKQMRRCKETVINATKSKSLEVICDAFNNCENSIIFCSSNVCSVDCIGNNACNGVIIHANTTRDVTINCDTSNACDNILIYAQNASYFIFNSTSSESQHAVIYAQNAESVNIYCEYNQACIYMAIYGDNADSINIKASRQYGFANNILHGSNAGTISIICAYTVQGDEYACYNNKYYLPEYARNTSVYCYGTACNDFGDIYVHSSVSSMDLYINGCDECDSPATCIGTWTIHCNDTTEVNFDTFSGESCPLSECGCSELISNVKFEEDQNDIHCPALYYNTVNKFRYHLLWLLLIPILMITIYYGIKYAKTFVVDNVLVLIIGITQFDDKNFNLPNDKKNIATLTKLWRETHKYEVFVCNKDSLYCTKNDVRDFIDKHKSKLQNKAYNGLLVHIISHGTNNEYFMTSDMKTMTIDAIQHELITETEFGDNLDVIKIICYHACRGSNIYHLGGEEIMGTNSVCCCCGHNKSVDDGMMDIAPRDEVEMTEMKSINNDNDEKKSESVYRGLNMMKWSNKGQISVHSNSIIIYQNIKDRATSSKGYFTDCMYDAFDGNSNKLFFRKKDLITLIHDIGRNLEQITKHAEICTTAGIGTLRFNPIVFKIAKKQDDKKVPLLSENNT